MRTKVSVLVALMVVFGLSNTFAQQGRGNKGMRGGQQGQKACMQGKFFSQLSEEQQTQMKAFKVEFTKEMTSLKGDMGVLQAKLKKASTGDNVNTKEVNKLIDEMSELKATMMKKHFANKQKVRSILTEEQKVMFDAHAGKMMGKKGAKGQGRQGKSMKGGKGQGMGPRADMGIEHGEQELGLM